MKRIFTLFLMALICAKSSGQSVLISPTGDGGFETGNTFALNNWNVVNSANNTWVLGNPAGGAGVQGGSRAAYIGTTSSWASTNNTTYNHFYRDVAIPTGATAISLSFYLQWPTVDDGYDYLNVYTTTTSKTPVAGTLPGTGYTQIFSQTSTVLTSYTLETISLPSSLAGTTVRLVFTYNNDGGNPKGKAAIDNISLTYTPLVACATPAKPVNVSANSVSATSFSGTITPPSPAPTGYLAVTSSASSLLSQPANGTTYSQGDNIGGGKVQYAGTTTSYTTSQTLATNTVYYVFVYSYNSGCTGAPYYSTSSTNTSITTCPNPVTALTASSVVYNGFALNWTAPSGSSTLTYTVDVSTSSTFSTHVAGFPTNQSGTSKAVTGLSANTTYYYSVTASNSNSSCTNTAVTGNVTTPLAPCSGTPAAGTASAGTSSFCSSGSTTLTLSGYTSGVTGIGFQWYKSTDNVNFAAVSGATATTLSTGIITTTTYYYCKVSCSGSGQSGNSNVVTLSVSYTPTIGTQPASQAVCTASAFTLNVTATNAGSYQWKKDGANIPGATNATYTVASASASDAGSYTVIVSGSSPCGSVTSGAATITINPTVTGAAASASSNPICAGSTVTLTALPASTSSTLASQNFNSGLGSWTTANYSYGGTPANAAWTIHNDGYSYNFTTFHSNDNSKFIMSNSDDQGFSLFGFDTWTQLISPSFSTVGLSNCSLNFYQYFPNYSGLFSDYEAAVLISTNGGSTWTAVHDYINDGTVGAATAFANSTLDLSAYTGYSSVKIMFEYGSSWGTYWALDNINITGGTSYSYAWTSTPAGFTSAVQQPSASPTASTTYNVTIKNSYNCTATASTIVTVNQKSSNPTSAAASSASICTGQSTTLTLNGGGGGTGAVVRWYSGSCTGTLVGTGNNLSVSPTTNTIYYGRYEDGAPCNNTTSCAQIAITVSPASVGGTINSSTSVCSGTNSGTLTLAGNTGSITRWESSINSGTTWTNLANTTTSQSYTNLTQTTQYRALVQSGACSSIYSATAMITVNPVSAGGSVSGSAALCSGATGTLSLSGNTGNVVRWESSINTGTTWTNIVNTTASLHYTNLAQTTQYRALVQSGACSSTYSTIATITIKPTPTANISPVSGSACEGQSVAVDITGTADASVNYSINPGTAQTKTLPIPAINSPTNTGDYTYTINSVSLNGCSGTISNGTATVSIHALPDAAISGYSYVQIGNQINLTGATSGGNWSSDNTSAATIGNSTGIVTGASSGTTTITYNVSTTSGGTTCSGSSTKPVSITADYVTRNNGNFSTIATWKRGTVNGFVNATAIPAAVNTIEVQHDLTLDQDFQVGANKSFVMSAAGTLLIQPGKVFSSLGIVNFGHKAVTVKSDASGTGAIGQMANPVINADHVTIERYIGSLTFQQGRRAWRLVTSPITDKTIRQTWQEDGTIVSNYGTQITGEGLTASQASQAGFDYIGGGNHTSVKTYTAATASGSWDILPGNGTSGTNILTSSQPAWMLFVRGDRTVNTAIGKGITTLRATGVLNQAVTSVAVDHTKAYTLVGNPYAAPISFDNIYNSSISHTFVIWNSQQGAYGAYNFITKESNGSYTLVPFNATSGTTDNNAKYIQSGAGFFVSPASASTDGSITIDESSKNLSAAGGIGTFRESAQTDRKLWVNLNLKNSDTSATVADGVLTRFDDVYSPGTDGDDAVKQYNFNENLLIATDSHNLMIEARPDVQKTDTIHLELYGVSKRNYQFQIKADNFSSASGIESWLEDSYLNTKEAINLSGTLSTIDFSVTSDSGSWKSDRFRIVFENKTLAVLPVTLTSIKATPKDAGVSISWTVSNEVNIKGYTVEKSVDGGRTYSAVATQAAKNGTGAAITTYIAFDSQPVQGENLYRIRTEAKDGTVAYSSVVTVTIATATKGVEIAIYPNPVREGKAHLQLTNLQPGVYLAGVYSEGGQVVYQKKITISQAGSVQSEDLYVSKSLAQGSYRLAITDSKGTMVKEMKLIVAR